MNTDKKKKDRKTAVPASPVQTIVRHLDTYSISTQPLSGICKSPAFWGHFQEDKSGIAPLIYFKKPKWVSPESFLEIVEQIKLNLPKGFEIKGA